MSIGRDVVSAEGDGHEPAEVPLVSTTSFPGRGDPVTLQKMPV